MDPTVDAVLRNSYLQLMPCIIYVPHGEPLFLPTSLFLFTLLPPLPFPFT